MKKSTELTIPEPVHTIPLTIRRAGKRFTIRVKIFKTNQALNKYYRSVVKTYLIDDAGVYAATVFDEPDASNDFSLGECIYSLPHLHPSLIAHETVHMVFKYYETIKLLSFVRRGRREETFCELLEDVMDGVYKYIMKHQIPYTSYPSYRS